jgi:hypothetical protein
MGRKESSATSSLGVEKGRIQYEERSAQYVSLDVGKVRQWAGKKVIWQLTVSELER